MKAPTMGPVGPCWIPEIVHLQGFDEGPSNLQGGPQDRKSMASLGLQSYL